MATFNFVDNKIGIMPRHDLGSHADIDFLKIKKRNYAVLHLHNPSQAITFREQIETMQYCVFFKVSLL